MRKLEITRDTLKFMKDLQAKQFKQVMMKVVGLMEDAQPNDASQMKGSTPFWRADIGEFRIVYRFDDDTLDVWVIGRRNDDDAYRKFDRM